MLKIQQRVLLVLYRQLSNWLLHGLLIDRHSEFFIAKVQEQNENDSIVSALEVPSSSGNGDEDSFITRAGGDIIHNMYVLT